MFDIYMFPGLIFSGMRGIDNCALDVNILVWSVVALEVVSLGIFGR